jgi:uncharacterized membrane protein YphA (DoxX/SURF4 family)
MKRRAVEMRWMPRILVPMLLLAALPAWAHERFVKHNLKVPLRLDFFGRTAGAPFGINPNMLKVAAHVWLVLAAFLIVWFVRQPIEEFILRRVLSKFGGSIQRAGHLLACFLTDRPVRNGAFHTLSQWAVIFFLRSPGLVLMYSAANDSLVLPSYPLDPVSGTYFKFAQVALALLILTQTALPLCGALLFGTWLYLFRWGWMVACDATPLLAFAVVYVSSPWQSHTLAITEINRTQMRWVRLTLGVGFLTLGWLKVFNHNLVAGVGDNYPAIMDDPMINLFRLGTDPAYRRETWIISFGLAEVLSGFLVMFGCFTRVWCSLMGFLFTKLMLGSPPSSIPSRRSRSGPAARARA